MDREMKELEDSSSEESLGSDEEGQEYGVGDGNRMAGSDSLLDSSDSEGSSDEDVDAEMEIDEDALNKELAQINDKLAENPYSYECYGEKIGILKKLGDLDKLRETRKKFSEMYPLSQQLWLDWLKDEVKLACTEEEKDEVGKLFERSVRDYLSVPLWLEYINFRISCMDLENGQEKCRDVFERALGSCGLHVSMGSLIWDMYRDFETAMLGTSTTQEQAQAQENRFITLCRRQLSVPLLGMDNTYEYIKSKIDIDENTEAAYRKALERLSALEAWEGKLIQQSGEDKTQVYRDYIQDEKKAKSNPARIQCLYERAVADYPLDSSLWLEYLEYLSKNLKIKTIVLEVASRASRNCSWDVSVWLKYMHLVETFSETSEAFLTMKSVFEQAIAYCSSGEVAGTVWLKYLEFLRRNIDISNPPEKELEIFKKTFSAAEQHLLQLFAEPNDYISEILLFQARFEAQCAKGIPDEVANLWKDIMKRGYNQYSKTWLQYILQQVMYGVDVQKIRASFIKAVTNVTDDLHVLSSLWINFERDNGNLSTLQLCEAKISKEMSRIALAASYVEHEPIERRNEERTFIAGPQKGRKRKMNDNDSDPLFKKGRTIEDTVDSDNNTDSLFKVPTIPERKSQKTVEKKDTPTPTTRHGELVKHDHSKDNQTVFLSNLAYATEEESIRNFFNDIGIVEEIRLARDFKGRSKGFGYVCFSSTQEAKKALEKDRQPIEGRPAFVSKCDPDKSTRQKQFKYSTALEKNKLFVKGLPETLTADELRDMFKAHGDLKDCRLVTYRNGHSKGLAYVEYIDESCAAQAIMKIDGMEIGDKKISVAISNPPPRDPSKKSYQKLSTSEPSVRRTPKAFVPRSLQISGQKVTNKDPSGQINNAPKSNQDFRSMFLK